MLELITIVSSFHLLPWRPLGDTMEVQGTCGHLGPATWVHGVHLSLRWPQAPRTLAMLQETFRAANKTSDQQQYFICYPGGLLASLRRSRVPVATFDNDRPHRPLGWARVAGPRWPQGALNLRGVVQRSPGWQMKARDDGNPF